MSDKKKDNVNLGEGKVSSLLLKLAIPTVIAQVINMLYNIVDRIYIGHMPENGSLALTGVGLCFAIIMLISAFSSLVCAGGAPRASIKMGQKDLDSAEKILGGCFVTTIVFAIALTVLVEAFAEPMLMMFGASENTLPYALAYLRIYALGSIFVMMTLGMNMFITAQGFSQFSMITTLIGAITNIVLDPVLIFGFNMGVQGAAIATIFSQGISFVWVLTFLFGKKTILHLKKEYMKIDSSVILPCIALGISPFIMQSTEAVLNICFNSSLQKYGGDIAVGSLTIISSCMSLLQMPLMGLCQGAQPLLSYNFGARKNDRVKEGFKIEFTICVAISILFFLVSRFFPEVLASIFSTNEELITYTSWAMKIYMFGSFMSGVQLCCQNGFMALGQAKISLLMACLRKLILLIPLIYILPVFISDKVFAVFLAEPVSDIIAATVTGTMFFARFNSILEKGPLN